MKGEENKRISENLLRIRKEHGFTQEYIAKKMGISRVSYAGLENGNDISISSIEKISKIYGVPFDQILRPLRNEKKFQQMLFYVLDFFSEEGIPKTKLAKILYLVDFYSYYLNRSSMSGIEYIHRQYGPVADIFLEMVDDLHFKGKIRITSLSGGALIIKSLSFNNKYELLNDKEKSIIEEVCEAWKEKPTNEIVNYTHEQKPWSSTKDGEYIPYDLILDEDMRHVYLPI